MEDNNNSRIELVTESKSDFNILKEAWEWFYTIAIALVIAFSIKMYVVDIVRVDGPSMFPTLVNGDRLVVTKVGYTPQKSDIIILDSAYKNRMEYYTEYEEVTGKKLNFFTRIALYFNLPEELKRKYYIKRVIGMEGDTIEFQDGKVLINGEVLDEPYYDGATGITDIKTEYPFTVSDDCIFVMGDNRPNSKDSRSTSLGEVPVKAVAGKAVVRLWPINAIGALK